MNPKELAINAASVWNANNPAHFPGRPLFEGVVENAVRIAVLRCVQISHGFSAEAAERIRAEFGLPAPGDE